MLCSSRRGFVGGLLAASVLPRASWADAGNPSFLTAGQRTDGQYVLCGLDANGMVAFELPLPERGHAAVAHPTEPLAVAFARRPGTYAIVLDCATGEEAARIEAPAGRHFYGHGAFSQDGDLLFTTENDFEKARGVIGIWDAKRRFERVGEFSSGGVGPHDICLMPDGKTLVVANGGIETHPETGRTKLNIPTMQSSLCYLELHGRLLESLTLGEEHQRNSIRHLAVSADGTVAFAMQWQGDLGRDLPLLGIHDPTTGGVTFAEAASVRGMTGYLGSVAFSLDGERIAVTSPRAGRVQEFYRGQLDAGVAMEDVCGVSASEEGFFLTTGSGIVKPADQGPVKHSITWDNHLITI